LLVCAWLISHWPMIISCSIQHTVIFCSHFWKWNCRFNGNSRCVYQFVFSNDVNCQCNTAWWRVSEWVCNTDGTILTGESRSTRRKTFPVPLCSP
jgi:hypothetical protein